MYKDKEKQKQAQKDWVRQKRAKGSTKQGMAEGSTKEVIAKGSTGYDGKQGVTATKGTKNTGYKRAEHIPVKYDAGRLNDESFSEQYKGLITK